MPCVLLALLLLPFPRSVHKQVLKLTDSILFYHPHPNIQLSLFWISFGVSFLTLVATYQAYDDKKATYYSVKEHGGNTEVALAKLLGECLSVSGFQSF